MSSVSGDVYYDSDNALHVEFTRSSGSLDLVFPSDEKPYAYLSEGTGEFRIIEHPTFEEVHKWLKGIPAPAASQP